VLLCLVRDRADALFVAPDGFFVARRVQFATLASRYGIPATYPSREVVEVGGLMSYGTDLVDMYRQVGVYTGEILKGAKTADLPALQFTKFEFAINLQTARALGIEVPNSIQLLADDVIKYTFPRRILLHLLRSPLGNASISESTLRDVQEADSPGWT
jgi:putative tryptophan/tyrosine transport system substrate-binding protein